MAKTLRRKLTTYVVPEMYKRLDRDRVRIEQQAGHEVPMSKYVEGILCKNLEKRAKATT